VVPHYMTQIPASGPANSGAGSPPLVEMSPTASSVRKFLIISFLCLVFLSSAAAAVAQERTSQGPPFAEQILTTTDFTAGRYQFSGLPAGCIKPEFRSIVRDRLVLVPVTIDCNAGRFALYKDASRQGPPQLDGHIQRLKSVGLYTDPYAARGELQLIIDKPGDFTLNVTGLRANITTEEGFEIVTTSHFANLVNQTAVSFTQSGAAGHLTLSLTNLKVSPVNLHVGGITLAIQLAAPGQTVWTIDLALGNVDLLRGFLVGTKFAFTFDQLRKFTLNSMTIETGGLTIEKIKYGRAKASDPLITSITGLGLDIRSLSLTGPPQVDLTIGQRITLSAVVAFGKAKDGTIETSDYSVADFSLTNVNGTITDAKGLKSVASGVGIKISKFTPDAFSAALSASHITIQSDGLETELDNLNLTLQGSHSAGLSGTGTVTTGYAEYSGVSHVDVKTRCGKALDVRLNGRTPALAGSVSITNGDWNATLHAGTLSLAGTVLPYDCEWDETYSGKVPVPPYPCGSLTKPEMCTSVDFSFQVRWRLSAAQLLSTPLIVALTDSDLQISDGHVKLCHAKAVFHIPPKFDFDLTPTIPGGNPVSDALRALIEANGKSFATVFVNTVGADFLQLGQFALPFLCVP
jgi:hypothetical protein